MFISRHTLKWTKTCRSSGDFPHAHTAHFLLNRHTLDFPLTEVEVFRTDRGGGFDDTRIDGPLDVFDIKGSPSRKGDPYDNAVVESANRLLKKELIYRNHHTGLEQPRSDLNDYVWWSDNQRLHSTLGYRSPNEFTQQGLVL